MEEAWIAQAAKDDGLAALLKALLWGHALPFATGFFDLISWSEVPRIARFNLAQGMFGTAMGVGDSVSTTLNGHDRQSIWALGRVCVPCGRGACSISNSRDLFARDEVKTPESRVTGFAHVHFFGNAQAFVAVHRNSVP
jgi:hypothetical protein